MCYSFASLLNDSGSAPPPAQTSPGVCAASTGSPASHGQHSYGRAGDSSPPINDFDDIPLDDPRLDDPFCLDLGHDVFLPPYASLDPFHRNPVAYYPRSTELYGQTHFPPVTTCNLSALCKVCGDKASGNHFGVLSCEACKSFFRRSIRTDARYSCRAGRCCVIDKQSRNRCQYCRLIKCVTAGMKKEAVQDERVPPAAKYRKSAGSSGYSSPRDLGSVSDDAEEKLGSESVQNSPSTAVREGVNFKIADILTNSPNIPNSPNTGADSTEAGVVQLDTFLMGIRACAIKLVEWARHIPAFAHLNFEDQVRLLKASWCDLYILHLAVHNGANPDTLVLGGGLTCKREQIGDPEVSHLIDRISSEVSSWFESLSTEPVEINCLKGILLFNPAGPYLSCEAKKEVEMYQEQILAYLENHSKSTHSAISQRFSKLLLRLGSIQSISKEMMQYLEVQQTLGHTHMDKLLLELFDSH